MKVYLDNAATTPLRDEVISSMFNVMKNYGNPSSTHSYGRSAKILVEDSRKIIAENLNVKPNEIIFNSGGTESDNSILKSSVNDLGIQTIITSKIEHHAILNVVDYLSSKKVKIKYVNVKSDGSIDLEDLESILSNDNSKKLVTLMHVNNEIGKILDLKKVSSICRKYSTYFHTDAVQSVGHFKFDLDSLNIDFLSASAHKFHGPKGIGFSFIRKKSGLKSFINGGSQERGLRGGTEAVHNIVGMSKAISVAYENLNHELKHILNLKLYLIKHLKINFPDVIFNGISDDLRSSSHTILNVGFPSFKNNRELFNFNLDLKGIACSKGSACQSGSNQGSHVLNEINSDLNKKVPSIRFSFSHFNKIEEIDYLVEVLKSFSKTPISL
tara:strand:+ start:13401 stop:14552 length:1152 start_codon:yes stop_codon:yes gene_type:complete